MNLLRPGKRFALAYVPFVLLFLLLSVTLTAQTRKRTTPAKKAEVKKKQTAVKDARKGSSKANSKQALAKKNTKADTRKSKASAKKADSKKTTASAKSRANDKNDRKTSPKSRKEKLAESRKALAERRKAEAARRAAALAERRRREQAAREARARRLAFERGLKDETAANIMNDNAEGEDLNVRRAAVSALGGHAGTVVVMEAKTGKVVTIVNQDWAIRKSFKPCSTIKLVTGVAGINEKVINSDGTVGSGGMDLQDALARSNNGYFQRVGSNLGSKKMVEYAHELGLGERTGINADGETAGRVPNGNNSARIYSHGDDFEVTPLQLAVMASALSNGGKKVVPQIQRQRVERAAFRPVVKENITLPERSIEGVLPGMVGAAEYGTARRGVDATMGVAGKTGSCIYKGTWIGLFASVAPVEDPKYSVVVITRGQSERGKYAAAIAGKVYSALRPRISRNPDFTLAKKLALPQKPAQRRAPVVDEDEEDAEGAAALDADVAVAADDEEAPIVVGAAARTQVAAVKPVPEQKKLVQRTTQSKPTNFQPNVITYDRSGAAAKERPRIVKNK